MRNKKAHLTHDFSCNLGCANSVYILEIVDVEGLQYTKIMKTIKYPKETNNLEIGEVFKIVNSYL